jgi:hypothetical protein
MVGCFSGDVQLEFQSKVLRYVPTKTLRLAMRYLRWASRTQNCNYRRRVASAEMTTLSDSRRDPAVTDEEAAVR